MYGDYPQIMKDIVGQRLPTFTTAQKAKLKNSAHFVGLNYYTSTFSNHLEKPDYSKPRWKQDSLISWERKLFSSLLPETGTKTNQSKEMLFVFGSTRTGQNTQEPRSGSIRSRNLGIQNVRILTN